MIKRNETLPILVRGLSSVIVVLFFSAFGDAHSWTGALREMWQLTKDTVTNQHTFDLYAGLSWVEVWETTRLFLLSAVFMVVFAYVLTSVRTLRRIRWFAVLSDICATLFAAIPEPMYVVFLVVIVLYYVEQLGVTWLPVFNGTAPTFADTLVPALALAIPSSLYLSNHMTVEAKEQWRENYVVTAFSKGLTSWQVHVRHISPNVTSVMWRQLPTAFGMAVSSALFVEFFMEYKGALNVFTNAVGWDMTSGYFGVAQKPFQLPSYQTGLTALIGCLLVVAWTFCQWLSTWNYNRRYGGTYEW